MTDLAPLLTITADSEPREAAEIVIARRKLQFRFMQHDAWENALFVHWPVDAALLARQLPSGLVPDIMEGSAWLGLVLLTERGVAPQLSAARAVIGKVDHLGANVRTYVKRGGVPGIFFFSLECSSLQASLGARAAGIPYFPARMTRTLDVDRPVERTAEEWDAPDRDFSFEFSSSRGLRGGGASVRARWKLAGEIGGCSPELASRAAWFVERYSVFTRWPSACAGLILRGDVQHPSWPLQPVEIAELDASGLMKAAGLSNLCGGLASQNMHACFSRGVGPIHFWMLEPV